MFYKLFFKIMSLPTEVHFAIRKRILRYIRGISNQGIWFLRNKSVTLKAFCDSDWAGCVDDMKNTLGYVFSLRFVAFRWSSRKQDVAQLSTAEAEYIVASEAANQTIWFKILLSDLGHNQSSASELFCDNKSAIAIVRNQYNIKEQNT